MFFFLIFKIAFLIFTSYFDHIYSPIFTPPRFPLSTWFSSPPNFGSCSSSYSSLILFSVAVPRGVGACPECEQSTQWLSFTQTSPDASSSSASAGTSFPLPLLQICLACDRGSCGCCRGCFEFVRGLAVAVTVAVSSYRQPWYIQKIPFAWIYPGLLALQPFYPVSRRSLSLGGMDMVCTHPI